MKIQILKENLAKALVTALKFTSSKAQLPILAHVKIEAQKDGIFIMATNLETQIRLRFAGKVVEPGEVVVPGKLLSEYVGVLPLGVVELTTETGEAKLKVSAKQTRASFQLWEADDFPGLPELGDESKLGVVEVKRFEEAWRDLEYAVSKDLARPVLTGVLWELGRGKLVATDGYRLSLIESGDLAFGRKKEVIIVSGNFWGVSAGILKELNIGRVSGYFLEKERQLVLKTEEVTLAGRLIEGDFPPYQAILPEAATLTATFEREAMLNAVKGALIFARDSAQIVKLEIGKTGIKVTATAQSGEAEATVDGEITGDEITAAFNGRYLVDFLSRAGTDRITLAMKDPLKPGKFTQEGVEGKMHVIMPIRLRGEGAEP